MSYAKIRPRRGTASQWTTANPILAEGEIGVEVPDDGVGTGLVKIKFGDGSTAWTDLPYGTEPAPIVQNLETDATDKVPSVSAVKAGFDEINQNLNNIGTISTEEQVIGKWIDGKPLYRKTVLFTSGSGFGEWALTDYISDYENVFLDTNFTLGYIEKNGVVSDCFYGTWGGEQRFSYVVIGNTTSKKFQVQRERTMKICATFLYTKTTD
jgi:hypothetical protein